jgi:hypothetical protein
VSSLACAVRGELRRSGVAQVAAAQKPAEVEATRMEALRREAERKAAEVEVTHMEALRWDEETFAEERLCRETERFEALRLDEAQFQAQRQRNEAQRVEALRREQQQQHAHTAGGAYAVALNVFSVAEIRSATDGFAAARKIGQGGFGAVFSGRLRGAAVAVKQLDRTGLQVRPSTPHLSSSLA